MGERLAWTWWIFFAGASLFINCLTGDDVPLVDRLCAAVGATVFVVPFFIVLYEILEEIKKLKPKE